MRTSGVLLPLVLVLGCAPVEGGRSDEDPTVNTLAADAKPVAGVRDCLDLGRVVGQRAEGGRAIVFETAGGAFRNDLPGACPGLERLSSFVVLVFEPKSGPLCRNDFVRAVNGDQLRTLGIEAFPRCRLGRFTPVPRSAR